MKRGAIFDVTLTYRYSLWRQWNPSAPQIAFIMLNPSTADAETDDPTIRRCIRFAQAWGYGSLEVVNLFALRATHPRQLLASADPVGVENSHYWLAAQHHAKKILIAWGNWGQWQDQDQVCLQTLTAPTQLLCLGTNKTGQPRHPLYVRADLEPQPFGGRGKGKRGKGKGEGG
jgi:hypothetical protein